MHCHSRSLAVGRTGACAILRLCTRVTQSQDCAHVTQSRDCLRNLGIAISGFQECATQSRDCANSQIARNKLKWSVGVISTAVDQQPAHCETPPLSYPIGPTNQTRGVTTPLQVFKLLLTTVISENIVQQTKLLAC